MQDDLEALLQSALTPLKLQFLAAPLNQFLELLIKWNKAYNLTAIRDPQEMIGKHILDSLAILPWLQGETVLDVGCGAGFPGIPLALACPDRRFVLLDSNGKKIRFLLEAKRILGLTQVEVVQARAENYQNSSGFDTVTSRAFTHLAQFIQWTQHLIKPEGIWLAMKGIYPQDELTSITLPYRVETYQPEQVAGERCCVIIENRKKD